MDTVGGILGGVSCQTPAARDTHVSGRVESMTNGPYADKCSSVSFNQSSKKSGKKEFHQTAAGRVLSTILIGASGENQLTGAYDHIDLPNPTISRDAVADAIYDGLPAIPSGGAIDDEGRNLGENA